MGSSSSDLWPSDLSLRAGRDDDATALIRLIGDCFADYENCVLDLDGIDAELKAIASHFAKLNGQFRVLEHRDQGIVACIGWNPHEGGLELKKLYVDPAWRRRGLARKLVQLVFDAARQNHALYIDLWSDSRFVEAHQLYQALGFERKPQTRQLNDPSNTTEFYFRRPRD